MASAVKLWIGIRDGNPTAASAAARQIKKEGFVDVLEVLSDHVNDCASRQVDWRLVRVKDERNKCKIAPASRSLLGALWAQLCVAIVESGEFRQCPVCGKYYPIGPGYYRPDKSTCSAKCAKAHTRGHYLVRVRALSEAGLSIHEIASKIAAQAAVVRMWLSTPHDDDEDE